QANQDACRGQQRGRVLVSLLPAALPRPPFVGFLVEISRSLPATCLPFVAAALAPIAPFVFVNAESARAARRPFAVICLEYSEAKEHFSPPQEVVPATPPAPLRQVPPLWTTMILLPPRSCRRTNT